MKKDNDSRQSRRLARREFLRLAAIAGLLAGCRPLEEALSPTIAPSPPPTRAPTRAPTNPPTAAPTAAPMTTAVEEPTTAPTATATSVPPPPPNAVVYARHAGVWNDEELNLEVLGQMLDDSISTLTGKEPATAWASLFGPRDRVAIKVNAIGGSGYWTHVPLVLVVAERLIEVGIAAEQIVIFDRYTYELEGAGYPINRDGPGIRCYGTDGDYAPGWQLMERDIGFSQVLLDCDALINMPILKQHGMAGISLALKNHYGTFDQPARFHSGQWMEWGMAELSTLPPIRDRTRLIIGDALAFVRSDWYQASPGDGLLMSQDPVAHDRIGLELISQVLTNEGRDPAATRSKALGWLFNGTELGLGTSALEEIPLLEVNLT